MFAGPGAWPGPWSVMEAAGPQSPHGRPDASVLCALWTRQNCLTLERQISQSSPLKETQTTGPGLSHNEKGAGRARFRPPPPLPS